MDREGRKTKEGRTIKFPLLNRGSGREVISLVHRFGGDFVHFHIL